MATLEREKYIYIFKYLKQLTIFYKVFYNYTL